MIPALLLHLLLLGAWLAEEPRATLARWRESLELDLAAEVIAEAPARIAADGPLAKSGEALALYARALASSGQEPRALELCDAARFEPAERAWVEIARARILLGRDDLAGTVALLSAKDSKEVLSAKHPEQAEAWLLLGRALWRGGQRAQARQALERFVKLAPLDPEAPAAWHMLAQEALGRDDAARAQECTLQAEKRAQWSAYHRVRRLQIRENPKEPLPRLGLAQLWVAAGEDARARAVLDELVALAPDFARAHLELARLEKRAGNLRAAGEQHARYRALGGTEDL